jgi:hypothetical protein
MNCVGRRQALFACADSAARESEGNIGCLLVRSGPSLKSRIQHSISGSFGSSGSTATRCHFLAAVATDRSRSPRGRMVQRQRGPACGTESSSAAVTATEASPLWTPVTSPRLDGETRTRVSPSVLLLRADRLLHNQWREIF